MHLDDKLLVEKSRAGDLDAFEELVKRYEGKVYTVAYRFVGNHADASDLAQETFVRVYQSLPGFRGESSFATWLYRIAANVCRDDLRKKQRRQKVSLDEIMEQPGGYAHPASTDIGPEEAMEQLETRTAVQVCLNSLSEEHRLVLVMREVQGLSYEEIAAVLGCSLGTVKSRINRARQALKQKINAKRELFALDSRLAK